MRILLAILAAFAAGEVLAQKSPPLTKAPDPKPIVLPQIPIWGWGGGMGWGWNAPYAYFPANVPLQQNVFIQAPALAPATVPSLPNIARTDASYELMAKARAAATLSVTLPQVATWTVDGKQLDGEMKARELTSPDLPLGSEHTFKFRATWKADGKMFEVEKSATVRVGERGTVTIYAGVRVKQ